MEVGDSARRDEERGSTRPEHVPVEDHARISPALVRLEEIDDRVPARLLLAVAREPHVHGQGAVCCEQRGRLQEDVQLALVVGDPACVEPAVAHGRLERGRLPEVERRGRLDVEVPVRDYRRRTVGALGRAELADDERMLLGRHQLGLPAGGADEVPHPFGGEHDVVAMLGIGTHARDAEELGELLHPLCGRLRHGGGA